MATNPKANRSQRPAKPKKPAMVIDPEIQGGIEALAGDEIDNKHLASCLLESFGGAEGLAKKTAILYRKSKPGSLAQNAILRTVYDVIARASPKESAEPDISDMSQQEMAAVARALFLGNTNEQQASNAKPEPGAAS